MKVIRTFILRLLVDSDRPGDFCGSLQLVLWDSAYSFKSEQDLLLALHKIGGIDPANTIKELTGEDPAFPA